MSEQAKVGGSDHPIPSKHSTENQGKVGGDLQQNTRRNSGGCLVLLKALDIHNYYECCFYTGVMKTKANRIGSISRVIGILWLRLSLTSLVAHYCWSLSWFL